MFGKSPDAHNRMILALHTSRQQVRCVFHGLPIRFDGTDHRALGFRTGLFELPIEPLFLNARFSVQKDQRVVTFSRFAAEAWRTGFWPLRAAHICAGAAPHASQRRPTLQPLIRDLQGLPPQRIRFTATPQWRQGATRGSRTNNVWR